MLNIPAQTESSVDLNLTMLPKPQATNTFSPITGLGSGLRPSRLHRHEWGHRANGFKSNAGPVPNGATRFYFKPCIYLIR